MSIHAHGQPEREAPHGRGVMIDVPFDRIALLTPRGSQGRVRFTIEEAQQLQRQLGVAIGEAAGQKKLNLEDRAELHSHSERSRGPAPYTGRSWMENQGPIGGAA